MPIVAVNGGGNTPNGGAPFEADGPYLLTRVEHTAREFLGDGNTLNFSRGGSEVGPIHPSLLGLHIDTEAGGSRLFVGNLSLDSGEPQRGTDSFQILSAGRDAWGLAVGSPGELPVAVDAGRHTTLGGDWDMTL